MTAPSALGSPNRARPDPSPQTAGMAAAPMGWLEIAAWVVVAAVSFHAAYAGATGSLLILFYHFALAQLAGSNTWRQRCYYLKFSWLAPASTLLTGIVICGFAAANLASKWRLIHG